MSVSEHSKAFCHEADQFGRKLVQGHGSRKEGLVKNACSVSGGSSISVNRLNLRQCAFLPDRMQDKQTSTDSITWHRVGSILPTWQQIGFVDRDHVR